MPEAWGRPLASRRVPEAWGRPLTPYRRVPEAWGRPLAPYRRVPEAWGRPLAPYRRVPEAWGRPLAPYRRVRKRGGGPWPLTGGCRKRGGGPSPLTGGCRKPLYSPCPLRSRCRLAFCLANATAQRSSEALSFVRIAFKINLWVSLTIAGIKFLSMSDSLVEDCLLVLAHQTRPYGSLSLREISPAGTLPSAWSRLNSVSSK